eukprot:8583446-Heterocapsa_arctica.AAC.1
MPLGLQGCQVHKAGVHDERGALSGKHEQSSSRTMSDDNVGFSKVGEVTMCCRRSITSLIGAASKARAPPLPSAPTGPIWTR